MKLRILSLLLASALLLSILPSTAMAVDGIPVSVWVGGVEMAEGTYLPINADSTTDTMPDDGYAHYENGVLTLHNYCYSGMGSMDSGTGAYGAICAEGNLNLILMG